MTFKQRNTPVCTNRWEQRKGKEAIDGDRPLPNPGHPGQKMAELSHESLISAIWSSMSLNLSNDSSQFQATFEWRLLGVDWHGYPAWYRATSSQLALVAAYCDGWLHLVFRWCSSLYKESISSFIKLLVSKIQTCSTQEDARCCNTCKCYVDLIQLPQPFLSTQLFFPLHLRDIYLADSFPHFRAFPLLVQNRNQSQ